MNVRIVSMIVVIVAASSLVSACSIGPDNDALSKSQKRQQHQVAAENGTTVDEGTTAATTATDATTSTKTEKPAKPEADKPAAAAVSPAVLAAGKEKFSGSCAGCHTLKDAGATGAAGPNLDTLAPLEAAAVLAQINNGGGAMPPGLASGDDAAAIAAYVAAVAGK